MENPNEPQHTEHVAVISRKKSLLNQFFKVVLPLLLGILILYFLFKGTNFDELWAILKDANWGILAFSLIFGLLGNTLRGVRWDLLIRPLGYTPRRSSLIYAIYGGYAVNFALPRAGEVWRCGVAAKEEKIPIVKLVGTIIMDRLLDVITVVCLLLIAFVFNMDFLMSELGKNPSFDKLGNLLMSPYLYAGIVVAILLVVVVFRFFRENFIVKKIINLVDTMWNDIKAMGRMKTKNLLFLTTVGIWLSYFLYFYITFFAFDFTAELPFAAGITAFALSSLSMGVPTNGGMGAWHFAVIASLGLYAIDKTQAMAFATGVFALQSLWVIFCGLIAMGVLAMRKPAK